MSKLIAKGIVKTYGNKDVLHGVDLDLESGKIYGLIGRNGAGKTTLLSILTAQNQATRGTVELDGAPVWENPKVLEHFCFSRELSQTSTSGAAAMKVKEDEAGYLGIQGVTVDDTMQQQLDMPAGVYVYRIVEGGAAEKTDLHEKDVITKFDGQRVKTMASLQDLLKYYKKGETVEMVVESLADGEYVERTITITLGEQVSAD